MLIAAILAPFVANALVFEDTFDGDGLDEQRWVQPQGGNGGSFEVGGGGLNFVATTKPPANNTNWAYLGSRLVGSASKDFDLVATVQITGGNDDRLILLKLMVSGYAAYVQFRPPGTNAGSTGLTFASMWNTKTGLDWVSGRSVDFRGSRAELRLQFSAQNKLLRAYYRDADQQNAPWQQIASFGIGASRVGSDGNLDWKLKSDTSFWVSFHASANSANPNASEFSAVRSGEMVVEDITFTQPASVDPARVVYNSFGGDDRFRISAPLLPAWDPDRKRGLASPFVVPDSGDRVLDSVSLPLSKDYGNNLEISVWSDQGSTDTVPKWTKVETLAINPAVKFWYQGYPSVLTFQSKLHPLLMRGKTYWLRVEPITKSLTSSTGDCLYSWYCASAGSMPKLAYLPVQPGMKTLPEWTFSAEDYLAAFRVEGTALAQNFTLTKESPYWDFRTPPGPAIKLAWDAVSGATTYEVWRDGVLVHPKTGTFTGRTFTNEAGLTPGATHTFQIIAVTTAGKSVSNTISAIMPNDPGASATKPGGLALRADNSEWVNGAPSVVLRWTDASGGNNYEILRNGVSLGKVGDQNEFTDNLGLKPGATVKYQIKSKNSAGITASNTVPVLLATAPPAAVGNFTLTPAKPTLTGITPKKPSVVLNWTSAPEAKTYDVFRNDVRIAKDLPTKTHTDAAGLVQGAAYSYYILAKGPGGETYSTDKSVTMPAEAITSLGDFKLTYTAPYWDDSPPPAGPAVVLNWTASANADYYSVYRDNELYEPEMRGRQFTNDKNLTPGGTHTFFVRAVNGPITKDSKTVSILMPSGPAAPTTAILLKNDVPTTVAAGNATATRVYKVEVTQQVERLVVTSQGGTGEIDLYIQAKTAPKLNPPSYIDPSENIGNNEQVEVANPVAGTVYYVLVSGKQAFSGVTLTAKLIPGLGKVGDPKVEPWSQPFTKAFDLVMTPTTPDSDIWYTIGANPPRPEAGKCELYDARRPRRISGTTNIIAIASKAGMKDSSPVERSYTASPNMSATTIVPFQTVEIGTIPPGGEPVFELDVPTDQIAADSMSGVACVGFYFTPSKLLSAGEPVADIYFANRPVGQLKFPITLNALYPQLGGKEFGVLDLALTPFMSSSVRDLGGKWVVRVRSKNQLKPCGGFALTAYYTPVTVRSISGPIQQSKETWLVCHGRADTSQSFESLAANLDKRKPDDQVLLVDWLGAKAESLLGYSQSQGAVVRMEPNSSAESTANLVSLASSRFLDTTADKIYSWLRLRQIPPNLLNWVGHSWGALMGFEFADQASASGGISSLVALDPASSGAAASTLSGDIYSRHGQVDFRTNTGYSMSFVAPTSGISFGDVIKASKATDSFLVDFGLGKDVRFSADGEYAAHRGVKLLYEKMLDDCYPLPARRKLSEIFKLENATLRPPTYWTQNRYKYFYDKDKYTISEPVSAGIDPLLFEGVIHATLSSGEPIQLNSIDYLEYFNIDKPAILSD